MVIDWKRYTPDEFYDAISSTPGYVRVPLRNPTAWLRARSFEKLQLRKVDAAAAIINKGVTFTVYSDGENIDRAWPLDITSRIMAIRGWRVIEAGLMRAWRTGNVAFTNTPGCGVADDMSMQDSKNSDNIAVHRLTSTLNACQMFRMYIKRGVYHRDVVSFLLQNDYLPRSVVHCLNRLEACLSDLPLKNETLNQIRDIRWQVDRIKPEKLDTAKLHQQSDLLQNGISSIHNQIRKNCFALPSPTAENLTTSMIDMNAALMASL